ncbi:hypothetical protein [Aureimonas psammosilenae]|uniref:hypothetical protein n=1 Tax=Aureimonas psammosilenae TaxID=2495496 RepID=UPI00126131DA|nr:hypothetical protein [Aureimonas psammosilenae]
MADMKLPGKTSPKDTDNHEDGPLRGGKPVPPEQSDDHPSKEAEERSRQVREGDHPQGQENQ